MKTNKIFRAITILSLVFLSVACTRKEVDHSSITIEFPKTMGVFKNGTMSSMALGHLVINVTGPGINEPILATFSRCHECEGMVEAPSVVTLDVPQGEGRLFQALAVYMDTSGAGGMSLFYGDKVSAVSGSSAQVPVFVSSVGGANEVVSGTIAGRFITGKDAANKDIGPTGIVNIKYAPPGKPSLILEKSKIISGWFSFLALRGAEFKYELEDGSALFGGRALSIDDPYFAPKAHVLKTYIPLHKRMEYTDEGGSYLKTGEPEIFVQGYFGPQNLVNTKKVCLRDELGLITTHMQHLHRAEAPNDHLTVSNLAPMATNTDNLSGSTHAQIYTKGGDASVSCDPDSLLTPFSQKLEVDIYQFDGMGKDGALSVQVPFAMRQAVPGMMSYGKVPFSIISGVPPSTDKYTLLGSLLPGVRSHIQSIKVYKLTGLAAKNANYDDSNPFPCSDIGKTGFSLSGEATFVGDEFTVRTDATTASAQSGLAMGICFVVNGKVFPQGGFVRSDWFSAPNDPGSGGVVSQATSIDLDIDGAIDSSSVCRVATVQLKNEMGAFASYGDIFNIKVTATHGTVPYPILFYLQPDCSDTTPVSNGPLSIQFGSGDSTKQFGYKLNGSSVDNNETITFNVEHDDVSPKLTNVISNITKVFGGMVKLEAHSTQLDVNAESCAKINIYAKDANGTTIAGEESALYLAAYIPSSGATDSNVSFYSGGCNTTAIDQINLTAGEAEVFVKSTTPGFKKLSFSYTALNSATLTKYIYQNVSPENVATKLSVEVDSGSNNLQQGQCIKASAFFQNSDDAPVNVQVGTLLQKPSISLAAPAYNARTEVYTDSNCSSMFPATGLNVDNLDKQDFFFKAYDVVVDNYVSASISARLTTPNLPEVVNPVVSSSLASMRLTVSAPSTANCQQLTVDLQDQTGAAVANKTGQMISFEAKITNANSTYGADYKFYTDSGCVNDLGSTYLQIPVDTDRVSVYIKKIGSINSTETISLLVAHPFGPKATSTGTINFNY